MNLVKINKLDKYLKKKVNINGWYKFGAGSPQKCEFNQKKSPPSWARISKLRHGVMNYITRIPG